jgi:hypothetical protein
MMGCAGAAGVELWDQGLQAGHASLAFTLPCSSLFQVLNSTAAHLEIAATTSSNCFM